MDVKGKPSNADKDALAKVRAANLAKARAAKAAKAAIKEESAADSGRAPARRRRRRKAIGQDFNRKLSIPENAMEALCPEWALRWVNDKDGRIHQFNTLDDWEFVTYEEIGEVGDDDITPGGRKGNHVSRPVGGGVTAHLMKKRKEYFDEDQAEKQKHLDLIDAALKRGKHKTEDLGDHGYVPERGISIKTTN